jgi:hypothetical protein
MTILLLVCSSVRVTPQELSPQAYLPVIQATGGIEGTMGLWEYITPVETTNLITDPSFETGTTGWGTGGINTIAQSATQQKYGVYSLLCTYQNSQFLASYVITLTAAAHSLSVWVYIPTAYDGTDLRIQLANFAGGTGPGSVAADMTSRDQWQRVTLENYVIAPGDLTGTVQIVEFGAAPTAGRFIYIDAVQVEQQTSVTTYCDGDQLGCEWNGAAHASTSTRSPLSRAGGTVVDFEDLNFEIGGFFGAGMAGIVNNVDSYAILPGGELNSVKTPVRSFTLTGWVRSDDGTRAGLHRSRDALIQAVAPNGVPSDQPVILRYTGADITKEIAAYYDAGLEGSIRGEYNCLEQRFSMRFIATDPNWYEIGNSAAVLDVEDTIAAQGLFARDETWDSVGVFAIGGIVQIRAMAEDGQYVYIGGDFATQAGDANQSYITRYNRETGVFSAMGTGLNARVWDIQVGPDGTVYIAGEFTAAGGDIQADYFCTWDGTTFNNLGDPDSGGAAITSALSIAIAQNGDIYVGGNYTAWAGTAANHIVYWDVSAGAWTALSANPSAAVNAVDVHPISGDIYMGGLFVNYFDADGDYIARWDGTNGFSLAPDLNAAVDDIAIDGSGLVYVVGQFTAAADANGNYVTSWTGQEFRSLSTGLGARGLKAEVAPDGLLFIVGTFLTAGSLDARRAVIWNGSSFAYIDFLTTVSFIDVFFDSPDPVIPSNYRTWISTGGLVAATSAGLITATNDGTQDAYPIITFSRSGGTSATIRTVRNEDLGLILWFDYDLLDGETLTIDLTPTSKSIVSDFRGSVLSAILANSDFGTWRLGPGDNNVSSFVDIAGGATVTATMQWRDPWWGVDD